MRNNKIFDWYLDICDLLLYVYQTFLVELLRYFSIDRSKRIINLIALSRGCSHSWSMSWAAFVAIVKQASIFMVTLILIFDCYGTWWSSHEPFGFSCLPFNCITQLESKISTNYIIEIMFIENYCFLSNQIVAGPRVDCKLLLVSDYY